MNRPARRLYSPLMLVVAFALTTVACGDDTDASADRRAVFRKAYLRTRSLGTITRAELASLLGVTLSLSDSDGDS